MSAFEFILDFGDDRSELRIGDHAPLLGGRMTILGRAWVVDGFVPLEGRTLGRFMLRLADRETTALPEANEKPLERERREIRQSSETSG